MRGECASSGILMGQGKEMGRAHFYCNPGEMSPEKWKMMPDSWLWQLQALMVE